MFAFVCGSWPVHGSSCFDIPNMVDASVLKPAEEGKRRPPPRYPTSAAVTNSEVILIVAGLAVEPVPLVLNVGLVNPLYAIISHMIPTKEKIIEEIKRTAKENGGTPLGATRFQRETGISSYEWGRYRARFGDALIAAGFPPNRLVQAYPDEFMVEPLTRVPTR